MSDNASREVECFAGYVTFEGTRIEIEFEVPAGATDTHKDAAFLAALAQRVELNYVCVGAAPAAGAGRFAARETHQPPANVRYPAGLNADRVFRIAWGEGYPPKAPERHPLSWFNQATGFDEDDLEALLALEVGATYTTGGPVARVTITREQ